MVHLTVRVDSSYYGRPSDTGTVGFAYEVRDTSNNTPDTTLETGRDADQILFESPVEAEMYGILQALQVARSVKPDSGPRTVLVKCDCEEAIESLSQGADTGRGETVIYSVIENFYSVSYECVNRSEVTELDAEAGRAARNIRNS